MTQADISGSVTRIAKPPRLPIERFILDCANSFVPRFRCWVHPAGMPDHSRGLSAATPPDAERKNDPHPEGVPDFVLQSLALHGGR